MMPNTASATVYQLPAVTRVRLEKENLKLMLRPEVSGALNLPIEARIKLTSPGGMVRVIWPNNPVEINEEGNWTVQVTMPNSNDVIDSAPLVISTETPLGVWVESK